MPLPDERQRNPGYEEKKKEEKEAERRKTLFRNLRSLAGCGAAPTFILPRVRGRKKEGAARLPAFHRGSRPRDSRIPRLNSDQAWRNAAPVSGGLPPPAPARLQRCTSPVMVPAGMMSEPPGRKGDEPLPAGTATRSAGRSDRPASLQENGMRSFSSPRRANSRNSAGRSHRSDVTRVFPHSLFDLRAPKV
jgi:hypothetical protein